MSIERYIISDIKKVGAPRILEVDNRLVIPGMSDIRILTTSSDVIHCWAIPRMAIKTDAIPGRLNQRFIKGEVPGIFYGQCSEICGANHPFMPISLEVVRMGAFLGWLVNITTD